jgi:hypothetical protein
MPVAIEFSEEKFELEAVLHSKYFAGEADQIEDFGCR